MKGNDAFLFLNSNFIYFSKQNMICLLQKQVNSVRRRSYDEYEKNTKILDQS